MHCERRYAKRTRTVKVAMPQGLASSRCDRGASHGATLAVGPQAGQSVASASAQCLADYAEGLRTDDQRCLPYLERACGTSASCYEWPGGMSGPLLPDHVAMRLRRVHWLSAANGHRRWESTLALAHRSMSTRTYKPKGRYMATRVRKQTRAARHPADRPVPPPLAHVFAHDLPRSQKPQSGSPDAPRRTGRAPLAYGKLWLTIVDEKVVITRSAYEALVGFPKPKGPPS